MMPGQPWSAKNQAERIMFGGLYVTVMDNDSASTGGSETIPPFQTRVGRRYYKGIDRFTVKNQKYGGGRHFNIASPGTVYAGGYWHNGNDKAVSFCETATYVAGHTMEDTPYPGYEVVAACLAPASIAKAAAYPAMAPYCKYTLIRLIRKYDGLNYDYKVVRAGIYLLSGGSWSVTTIDMRTVATGSVRSYCTQFDFSARKIGIYDSTLHAAYGFETVQTVTLLSFADDYATNSSAIIYSGTPEHRSITETVETTSESGVLSDWLYTNTRSQSLAAGDAFVVDVKMDGNDLCLLRQRTIAYSLSQTDTALSIGYLSRSGYSHFSKSETGSFVPQVCKLSFAGVVTVWEPISVINNSDSQASNTDVTASPRSATVSVNVSSSTHRLDVMFYSHRKKAFVYRDYLVTESDSGSGSGSASTFSGSQTDVNDYDADYRIVGDTVDVTVLSTSDGNTNTTSKSWPASTITFLSAENGTEYSTTTYPGSIWSKAVKFIGGTYDCISAEDAKFLLLCGRFGATSATMADKTLQVDLSTLAHQIDSGRVDVASGAGWTSQMCASM